MKVVTGSQMAEIDRLAGEAGVSTDELMENAGRAVADEAAEMLGSAEEAAVIVVCGKGNNGGDGLVAARFLKEEGAHVVALLAGDASELRGVTQANLERARQAGVAVVEQVTADRIPAACEAADLVIDALLGTGVRGAVKPPVAGIIEALNRGGAPVLAIDVPSGVDADTGGVASVAVRADRTVSLGLLKWGLLNHPGAALTGTTVVADIGLPESAVAAVVSGLDCLDHAEAGALLPRRSPDVHKGDCGRVLVIAGSVGYTGAAALSSLAALRAGAGLVTVAVPSSLNDVLEAKLTEVITRPMPETPARSLGSAALEPLLELAAVSSAVIVGPGLSLQPETQAMVRAFVERAAAPMVIDADALTALSEEPAVLRTVSAPFVLTPHPGEMARLIGRAPTEVQANRASCCRDLAEQTGGYVVLKGSATLIGAPDGRLRVNRTGNSGMATAGTGDVLTGVIAALIGQGVAAFDAASVGVHLHGLAGDLAAEDCGTMGLIASDVLEQTPRAIVRLQGAASGLGIT